LSECEQHLLANMTGQLLEYVEKAETWICHAKYNGGLPFDTDNQHWKLYVFCLGSDVSGPGFISPTSTPEYATNFIFQFIMLIVSNIFVGVVATAQSEADPLEKAFKARMDHLNHFLDDVNAPDHLKRRTREYLRYTKDLVAKQGFTDLYDMFSPKLRGDVLGHISSEILAAVPYFSECEAGFMREISQKLKHYGYEGSDRVKLPEPTLCVVTRGTAVRGGTPITQYQFWGEDMIVTSAALRDNRIASALTYIEIVCLKRSELVESCQGWEESAHKIRVEAMRISMIRAPQLIARYLREKAREKMGKVTPRSTYQEVDALNVGLANIGKNALFAHREYHAVVKKINGERPLRGFAREQRGSADKRMADLANNALGVAGDEGKLLIDEDGNVVGADGKIVEVREDEDDAATKAVAALRLDLRSDYLDLKTQMDEIKRAIALGSVRPKPKRFLGGEGGAANGGLSPAGNKPKGRRRRTAAGGGTSPVPPGGGAYVAVLDGTVPAPTDFSAALLQAAGFNATGSPDLSA